MEDTVDGLAGRGLIHHHGDGEPVEVRSWAGRAKITREAIDDAHLEGRSELECVGVDAGCAPRSTKVGNEKVLRQLTRRYDTPTTGLDSAAFEREFLPEKIAGLLSCATDVARLRERGLDESGLGER